MAFPFGALIGAGANLLGGLIGKSSSDDAMKANQKMAAQNIALQKEFAQSGIQWKVEDAKKAGIHPLYAMGAPATSFSPVSIGASGDTSLATGVANMGQDISRAVDATRSTPDRVGAFDSSVRALSLTKMGLENELLGAQIAKLRQSGSAPPMPIGNPWLVDGQGDTSLGGAAQNMPMQRALGGAGRMWSEPGAITDIGYSKTSAGGYFPVPSYDTKQRIEDDFVSELMWNLRNRLMPSFGINQSPPAAPLPSGYDAWLYSPFRQEYLPYRRGYGGIYY